MENFFNKTLSRRNFLTLTACSMFGMLPTVHAQENFKTLEELQIGNVTLDFDEMSLRTYTGAIIVHHFGLLRRDFVALVVEKFSVEWRQNF